MKVSTKQKIEKILTEELNKYITPYEINNTISQMDNGFDANFKINKEKLREATSLGMKYLNSICLPAHVIAAQPIYKNKVLIALTFVEKELLK